MRIEEGYKAIELYKARANAAAHIVSKSSIRKTLCGRDALGGKELPKLSEEPFDEFDPDVRMCRKCVESAWLNGGVSKF